MKIIAFYYLLYFPQCPDCFGGWGCKYWRPLLSLTAIKSGLKSGQRHKQTNFHYHRNVCFSPAGFSWSWWKQKSNITVAGRNSQLHPETWHWQSHSLVIKQWGMMGWSAAELNKCWGQARLVNTQPLDFYWNALDGGSSQATHTKRLCNTFCETATNGLEINSIFTS